MQVGPAAPGRNAGEQETRESRPALVVGTKLDLLGCGRGAELLRLELQERLPLLLTSAQSGAGLEALRKRIVEALDGWVRLGPEGEACLPMPETRSVGFLTPPVSNRNSLGGIGGDGRFADGYSCVVDSLLAARVS